MKPYMKPYRIALAAFLAGGISLLVIMKIAAATYWVVGSMTTVNGTSNFPSVSPGTVTIPGGYLAISHGALPNTNALVINAQWSIDGSNFYTYASWTATTTNTTGEAPFFLPSLGNTFSWRAQVVTTNSYSVGVNLNM